MKLSEKEIHELLENSFSIDFETVTLTQNGSDSPVVYSGPGKIFMMNNGVFHLKMEHTFVDLAKEIIGVDVKTSPGKILGHEHYFSLSGIDSRGTSWNGQWILPEKNLVLPSTSMPIEAKIEELHTEEPCDDYSKDYLLMIIKGENRIAPNKWEKYPNGGGSWNTFRSETQLGQLLIRTQKSHLTIEILGTRDCPNPKAPELLLESLSIAIGRFLSPVYRVSEKQGIRTTVLYSVPAEFLDLQLKAPVPGSQPHHYEALNEFIKKYLNSFHKPWEDFYGHWYRIVHASSGIIENFALVLMVAIEGIVNRYFRYYGRPDEKYKAQLNDALEKIKILEINEGIRRRMASSIGNALRGAPKNALKKIADENGFEPKLADVWIKSRNMSAHPEKIEIKDLQKVLDDINNCLLLFYLLLFTKIGYSNLYYDYSEENWPEKVFVTSPDSISKRENGDNC